MDNQRGIPSIRPDLCPNNSVLAGGLSCLNYPNGLADNTLSNDLNDLFFTNVTLLVCWLKVPLWSNFWFFIFLHFRVQLDLLTHLAKFQSITNIGSHFILTFISENLRPPLINLVPRLGCEWEKVTSKTQTYLTGWNYNNNKYWKSREKQQKLWTCSLCNFLCWLLL